MVSGAVALCAYRDADIPDDLCGPSVRRSLQYPECQVADYNAVYVEHWPSPATGLPHYFGCDCSRGYFRYSLGTFRSRQQIAGCNPLQTAALWAGLDEIP